jgi:hypothetical protein
VIENDSPLWTEEENEYLAQDLKREQRKENNSAKYLPSEESIKERTEIQKWMIRKKLGNRIIDAVMFEEISIAFVRKIYQLYGRKIARKKILAVLKFKRRG